MAYYFVLVVLVLFQVAIGESCQDKNEHCEKWANMGECNANPSYMKHNCEKACGVCGGGKNLFASAPAKALPRVPSSLETFGEGEERYMVDVMGNKLHLWNGEWEDADLNTIVNNQRINANQPVAIPPFTKEGFVKVAMPFHLHQSLIELWASKQDSARKEPCIRGYINNCADKPTLFIDVGGKTRSTVKTVMKDVLEKWIGGTELEFTSVYGIRRYVRGHILQVHVDVVATHAVSAILNVAQEADEDWPLSILDHDGKKHDVVINPGEMVLYESARLVHGRPTPFNGTSYDNIFVHFRPKDNWEWKNVPNGAVVQLNDKEL